MKAIIIYCSKTGFTKRYADWLAEELECSAVPADKRSAPDTAQYDVIIFASWFYAGTIRMLD